MIHAGALSSAEAVRRDPARAQAVNVEATRRLAAWAAARGRRLVFTSTDLVFDGSKSWNREDDPARPILAYGRTKLEAESHVLAIPRGLVARLSLLFGPTRSGSPDFFDLAIDALGRGERRSFFEDEFRTPLITARPPTSSRASSNPMRSGSCMSAAGSGSAVSSSCVARRSPRGSIPTSFAPVARPTPTSPSPGRPMPRSTPPGWPSLFPSLERPSIEAVLVDGRARFMDQGHAIGRAE